MKRLFLLLAVVGISFTACTEVGEIDEIGTTEQPDNGNTDNPETPTDPENPDNPETPTDPENPDNPETPTDPENPEMQIIKFQDENTKLICILHWDEDEDGELSYEEVAAVTNLGTAFKDSRILSFAELKYFTSLTNIANDEFEGCVSLVKISLPEQITAIGENAFSGCTNLKKIEIPNSVTSIGENAFYNCTSLTSITIPDSVTSIGKEAFYNCKSLASVYISDLSAWCKIDFEANYEYIPFTNPLYREAKLYLNGTEVTELTIPSDITEIKDYAFYNCTSLTSVTIPDSVTSIGRSAFYGCDALKSVIIGNGVTSIGRSAFCGCSDMESVTIGNGVTSIGLDAFSGCYWLESVNINDLSAWCKIDFPTDYTHIPLANPLYYGARLYLNGTEVTELTIPSDITEIKDYAFYNCPSLTGVTISNGVTYIGKNAFYQCENLGSVTIGNGVTSIGKNAFGLCKKLSYFDGRFSTSDHRCLVVNDKLFAFASAGLTEYTIPNIPHIGEYAFNCCESLISVTIPDRVTSIGKNAFYQCENLESVTIGNGVTSIGEYAFEDCKSLTSVYCKSTTPPTGGIDMFAYHNGERYQNIGCTIYVPRNSVSTYKSGWRQYANYIVGYDF